MSTPAATPLDIHHEPDAHRFAARIAGTDAVLEYETLDAKTLEYHHTFVPQALRGGGIASQLTAFALRYARENGLKVRPTCPFVARYLTRHPEFQPLVG
ncbi:MAG: GNAT family N-acetyltransferase [Gammaproteobacteria bacterium]